MRRIWIVKELEKGFLVEIQSEVPGSPGVISQYLERHAYENILDATNGIIQNYKAKPNE